MIIRSDGQNINLADAVVRKTFMPLLMGDGIVKVLDQIAQYVYALKPRMSGLATIG